MDTEPPGKKNQQVTVAEFPELAHARLVCRLLNEEHERKLLLKEERLQDSRSKGLELRTRAGWSVEVYAKRTARALQKWRKTGLHYRDPSHADPGEGIKCILCGARFEQAVTAPCPGMRITEHANLAWREAWWQKIPHTQINLTSYPSETRWYW